MGSDPDQGQAASYGKPLRRWTAGLVGRLRRQLFLNWQSSRITGGRSELAIFWHITDGFVLVGARRHTKPEGGAAARYAVPASTGKSSLPAAPEQLMYLRFMTQRSWDCGRWDSYFVMAKVVISGCAGPPRNEVCMDNMLSQQSTSTQSARLLWLLSIRIQA